MPAHQSERSRELQDLLQRLRPRILDLLHDHAVGEEMAAEIVHDTFMALAVRWGRVGNRESWILGTIEARCRALRSNDGSGAAESADPSDSSDSSDGGGGERGGASRS
jgi:hypothetical protein